MNSKAQSVYVFLCFLALASADVDQERHNTIRHESQIHNDDSETEGTAIKKYGYGHSIGSGLVSIAQGAAEQAKSAIQSQHEAGGQAAFQAKSSIAQNAAQAAATAQAALAGKQSYREAGFQTAFQAKSSIAQNAAQAAATAQAALAGKQSYHEAGGQVAFQAQNAAKAAATAQAALAGKQVIVSTLEQQYRDTHGQVEAEALQLTQAQRAATATRESAQQAQAQVRALTAALNAAQHNAEQATRAAQEAAGELASQSNMLATAKQRLNLIGEQLSDARADLEATQNAAAHAAAAAATAQANAAKHAAHAPSASDFGDEAADFVTKFGFHHSFY